MTKPVYPDPEQLRLFANEPRIVHDIDVNDLFIDARDRLRYAVDSVEYVFSPESCRAEIEPDTWVSCTDTEQVDETPTSVWSDAIDVSVREDFITATTFVEREPSESIKVDVTWVLKNVTIAAY